MGGVRSEITEIKREVQVTELSISPGPSAESWGECRLDLPAQQVSDTAPL